MPFVLHSQPTAIYEDRNDVLSNMASTAHKRYAEIFRDVEDLINNHIEHQKNDSSHRSKLKLLVPGVGVFFTPLLLQRAFDFQDEQRRISSRRFVPPSFNDIRLILNSAQVLALVESGPLELLTFDGDVTLYPDGDSLNERNPVISRIIHLLCQGTKVAIVTAAGYTEAAKYYGRLHGLLDNIKEVVERGELKDPKLIVLGGESNYLFEFDPSVECLLRYVKRRDWILPQMEDWTEESITSLLDSAEKALRECISNMNLSAHILRKNRAVGIVPSNIQGKLTREQLEETVLVTQQIVEMSPAAKKLPFCAFNGTFLDPTIYRCNWVY